jgi:hypothetical protein
MPAMLQNLIPWVQIRLYIGVVALASEDNKFFHWAQFHIGRPQRRLSSLA